MHVEPGERRDFLPALVHAVASTGADVLVESGIGSGMGLTDDDYTSLLPNVAVTDEDGAYRADVVLVLRSPDDRFDRMRRGAILISMLHFPTRPARVGRLLEFGIDAISLDSIADDGGRRLVENLKSVAWNGVDSAFVALERRWPGLQHARRRPVAVTIMGAGAVGKHAVESATKFGDVSRNDAYMARGLPGVEVVTIGRNLTSNAAYLADRLERTDILVDATQRHDASVPLVSNASLCHLPRHAVICDLVVDPYLLDAQPRVVRGIEGIPQGNLDRWILDPDDEAWNRLPPGIPTRERRTVASCYSWPGISPRACMDVYGDQLLPLLKTLIRLNGIDRVRPDGTFTERALWRGSLRAFVGEAAGQPSLPLVPGYP